MKNWERALRSFCWSHSSACETNVPERGRRCFQRKLLKGVTAARPSVRKDTPACLNPVTFAGEESGKNSARVGLYLRAEMRSVASASISNTTMES
jgi:hypothetical protein